MIEQWDRAKRMEFAIEFAGENLKERPPDSQWLKLREDLELFLGQTGEHEIPEMGGMMCLTTDSVYVLTEDDLRKLQDEMKSVLEGAVSHRNQRERGLQFSAVKLEYSATVSTEGFFPSLYVKGSVRDCLFGMLFHILGTTETKAILRCPECQQIFYRRGKQVFCTRTCTNRAMIRRKRERDREAELKKHAPKTISKKGAKAYGRKRSRKTKRQ